MLIRSADSSRLPEFEVTDEERFRQRRQLVKAMGLLPVAGLLPAGLEAGNCALADFAAGDIELNTYHEITHYNNYYEFSTNKQAVALLARSMPLRPWTLEVSGEVENPLLLDIDTVINQQQIVERIYRFRCVEGWSMVIPWSGFQLCNLLRRAKPTSRAKYVAFVSHVDRTHMIGMGRTALEFPYREALRIDEAMHPLTLLASGIYGKDLPPQNGAPLRLVVPWKYGFKSPKAIVKIVLYEQRPQTSWNKISPSEYGFFGNVNPRVAHPRWSQRREVRIGELKKSRTLMFNGYEAQVANLYQGMDLKQNY